MKQKLGSVRMLLFLMSINNKTKQAILLYIISVKKGKKSMLYYKPITYQGTHVKGAKAEILH